MPPENRVLSSTWLNEVLVESPGWPHGSIRVLGATRIGIEHGMSGRVHRVVVDADRGGPRSLVVKQERAKAIERELLFRHECATFMVGSIPACYGASVDAETGEGVLVLEDISPADQGDVLHGCTEERAKVAVSALAQLHARSWKSTDGAHSPTLPRWGARPMERDRWLDRLTRAGERFPRIVTRARRARLADLPDEVSVALDHLRAGPASWTQLDAHLDNVLWRSDGTAVLVDWSDAAIGPPVTDLARFISEGVDAESRPVLVEAYMRERERHGNNVDFSDLHGRLHSALLPLVQSAVGWAGREDVPPDCRGATVCKRWVESVCGWALGEDSGSQGGGKAS